MTAPTDRRAKVMAVIRVATGNFLEMYDFMVFGYYAAAIGRTFFPKSSEFASLMLSFATFGVGFLIRPLGAVVLGAYMDRKGRRAGLMLTLGLMSVGTLSIACVPGYAVIGLAAPLLVVCGRLLQGFSAGVELGSVSVYLSEIATPGHKGFYVSWQNASQQWAVVFAALLGVALSSSLTQAQMDAWGWRVPLLVGCLIVPFLFLIRKSLAETDGVPFAQASPLHPRDCEVFGRQLACAGARQYVSRHVHVLLLPDHSLYAHIRPQRAPPGGRRQSDRYGVRRRLKLLLAARNGRPIGPRGKTSHSVLQHRPGAVDRLPCAVVADRRGLFLPTAWRRTVALVPIRELQRRHGGLPDRTGASRGENVGVLAFVQRSRCHFRRLHTGHLHLFHSTERQSGRARIVVVIHRRDRSGSDIAFPSAANPATKVIDIRGE